MMSSLQLRHCPEGNATIWRSFLDVPTHWADGDRKLVGRRYRMARFAWARNCSNSRLTSAGCSCCTQWPAPSTRWQPIMFVQAVFCIVSNTPARWYVPQSCRPEMKQDGTSMVRPDQSWSSLLNMPVVPVRYHCRPPWNPVREYSAA